MNRQDLEAAEAKIEPFVDRALRAIARGLERLADSGRSTRWVAGAVLIGLLVLALWSIHAIR